jgi:UDP-N-acetylmuramoylalanine--D-glutamate ligase
MRNRDYFKNKNVTVVGLACSGIACANLLFDLNAKVSLTDISDNPSTRLAASRLKSKNINLELGRHSPEFIRGRDFIVVSPGVTNSSLALVWADKFNIPAISEIEVAWILCPSPVIATTGSSGKTTVATLIGKILEVSGKKAFICGNIGTPFSAEVDKMGPDDFVSLEVSSFQLERIRKFKPKIAVMLNFSRNHLDRHKDMQEYLEAKKRIFLNQDKNDFLVLNEQDQVLKNLAKETKAKVVYFSESKDLNPNQAAVVTVGSILGIDRDACLSIFAEFKGLEHRLEYVTQINNIKFINDSKATTVESTAWALRNISSPIILIAGGRDKGVDYKGILDLAREKVKEVILIGEAQEKIREVFKGFLSLDQSETMEEAVNKAFHKARAGDCVLLSPMCSSFDMFVNYEDRGRVFKDAVYNLAKNQPTATSA